MRTHGFEITSAEIEFESIQKKLWNFKLDQVTEQLYLLIHQLTKSQGELLEKQITSNSISQNNNVEQMGDVYEQSKIAS